MPVTRQKPPIATTVKRLRLRARLSQRRLAELGDISAGAIARIERGFDPKSGAPVKPVPDTLRGIAKGLAATEDEPLDEAAALNIYRELLDAAGYSFVTGPATPPQGPPAESRAANLAEITLLIEKIPAASISLADLGRGAADWDDDDVAFILARFRRLAEQFGKSQIAC